MLLKTKSTPFRAFLTSFTFGVLAIVGVSSLPIAQATPSGEVFRATSNDAANPGPYIIKADVDSHGDLLGLIKFDQPNNKTFKFSFEEVNSVKGAAILKKKVGFVSLDVVVVKGLSLSRASGGIVQVSYRISPLSMTSKPMEINVAKKNGQWAAFSRDNARQIKSMHFVTRPDGNGIAKVNVSYY